MNAIVRDPRSGPGARGETGFTLLEMLIATAVLVTVTAGVFSVVNPAGRRFSAQLEFADVQQRLRVAVGSLSQDLRMAGAGTYVGSGAGPLLDYTAPVLPYRAGFVQDDAAAGVFYRSDAITIVYVPPGAPQGTLRDAIAVDAMDLALASGPNCPPPAPNRVCGFTAGTQAILLDPIGATDIVRITQAQDPVVLFEPARALGMGYAAAVPIVGVESQTYYLRADRRAETYQLMRYDGYRSDLPVVDNVVSLEFTYWGAAEPPMLLPGASPADPGGPYTTYGPRPPPAGVDNVFDVWPAGENCVFALVNDKPVPRLPVLAAGVALVPLPANILTDGPWCPDDQHTGRFDADLLRVRRIRAKIRVQAALARLRGPAGVLFMYGGTASRAGQFVPDQEVSVDVVPRNLNLGR